MTAAEVAELLEKNGLPLAGETIDGLLGYERLLLDWNAKINLVSRRDTSDFFVRHIVGSAAFLFSHSLGNNTALLDVGTGGGLPGIPIAIIHPDIRVSVIDSIAKKTKAVNDIVEQLGIRNVRVLCGRVEECKPSKIGTFDYVVARGVSSSAEIVRWCEPLLRTEGRVRTTAARDDQGPRKRIPPGSYILLKGGDLTGELAALSESAGQASVTVRSLDVKGAESQISEKKVIIVTP